MIRIRLVHRFAVLDFLFLSYFISYNRRTFVYDANHSLSLKFFVFPILRDQCGLKFVQPAEVPMFLKCSSVNRHPPSLLSGFHGADFPPFYQYYEDAKTASALLLSCVGVRIDFAT